MTKRRSEAVFTLSWSPSKALGGGPFCQSARQRPLIVVLALFGLSVLGLAPLPSRSQPVLPLNDRDGERSPLDPFPLLPDLSPAIQQALTVIAELDDPADQITLRLEIARQLADGGQPQLAQTLLQQCLDQVPQVAGRSAQVALLLAIAQTAEDLGNRPLAIATLETATQLAVNLEDDLERSARLGDIAARYADWLEPAAAVAVLALASEGAIAAPPSQRQAAQLARLALQYADLGQVEQSAQLLAQGQTVLVALGEAESDGPAAEPAPASPLTPSEWSGSVGLLSNLFSGERTRGIVTLSAAAERQWRRNDLDLGLRLTYNFDRDRDDVNEFGGQLTTDLVHYLAERLQYFNSTSFTSDDLENLNLRASLTNGIGLNVWQAGPDRRLDLRLGLGVLYESFEDEDTSFFPVTASTGLSYQDELFDILDIRQTLAVDVPLEEAENYLFRSRTDLGIPIGDRWSFNNSVQLTLSGDPVANNPGLLLNLQTGLRYQF
ncbi:MAG: DUF481 domain-containing protein [Synechococcales bacterium]|nr:DUF481 domain-containing protein [Synechococcales bacterium]